VLTQVHVAMPELRGGSLGHDPPAIEDHDVVGNFEDQLGILLDRHEDGAEDEVPARA
jgi:hypothetical protein